VPWRGQPVQVGETIGLRRNEGWARRHAVVARPDPEPEPICMSPVSIFLIGIAMSTDAFAAAVGKGAAMRNPRLPEALRAGLIFGTIEGLTPVIGWALAATGFATSIDAMAVGVGLAFLDVEIAVLAVVIGVTTLVMVTLGIMLGRSLGRLAGKRAEIGGGVLLILTGLAILYEHLGGAAGVAGP
jgi:putative Mn2+ efflux pump MntP